MFPCLTIFIIFLLVLAYERRKSTRKEEEVRQRFWNRENAANAARKKDLSSLDYVQIPQSLYESIDSTDEEIGQCIQVLIDLSKRKIVNLGGLTNTDLKLAYGVANLATLTEYDENYTTLICCLVKLSKKLIDCGQKNDAIRILSFGVSCHSDITENYTLLASLYKETSQSGPLTLLYQQIQVLPEDKRETILRKIQSI